MAQSTSSANVVPLTGGAQPVLVIPSLTNAEKLASLAGTPIGTRRQVTDAFWLSGNPIGPQYDGYYAATGTTEGGKPVFAKVPNDDLGDGTSHFTYSTENGCWLFTTAATEASEATPGDEEFPWQATWPGGETLLYPAIQRLFLYPPSDELSWQDYTLEHPLVANAQKLSLLPESLTITGAITTSAVNQVYYPTGSLYFDKPIWRGATNRDYWIFWDDEAWSIQFNNSGTFNSVGGQVYLAQNQNDETPWGNTLWLIVPLTVDFDIETLSVVQSGNLVGTVVSVSDGFVVSGGGTADGFWYQSGTANGKPTYAQVGYDNPVACAWTADNAWVISNPSGDASESSQDVAFPWLVTGWTGDVGNPTLTHPAVQTLLPPGSNVLGVSGSSQDGVYTDRGIDYGKRTFNLLGQSDSPMSGGDGIYVIGWIPDQWQINDSGGSAIYYSPQDVATPDLVSEWRYATPAMQVSGGSQDGLYTARGAWWNPSTESTDEERSSLKRQNIIILGGEDPTDVWRITNDVGDGTTIYYALAAGTTTPDEATQWFNYSDDSPASIIVTSQPVADIAVSINPVVAYFVSGGTQDGVWTDRVLSNGKRAFGFLGDADGDAFNTSDPLGGSRAIGWGGAGSVVGPAWIVLAGNDPVYYSPDDVANPSLATTWLNAADDTPAGIVVSGITQGELDAGALVQGAGTTSSNGIAPKTSEINSGKPAYELAGIRIIDSGAGYALSDNVAEIVAAYFQQTVDGYRGAFPWSNPWDVNDGTPPEPTVLRDDVASEANWQNNL